MDDDGIYLASIYRLTAANFEASARILSQTLETRSDGMPTSLKAIPFYFLVSHAAELYLKSALLKRGFHASDLKKYSYGHNLGTLLTELQQKGIAVTPSTVEVIKRMDKQHQTNALRYTALVDDGEKTYMPPIPLIFGVLEELLLLTRLSTQGI